MADVTTIFIIMYELSFFLFAVISLSFLIHFIRNYIRTKQKIIAYLIFYLANHILANFFGYFKLVLSNDDIALIFHIISEILDMSTLFALIMLLEVFEKNTQFTIKQTIMSMFIFAMIGGLISRPPVINESFEAYHLFTYSRSPIAIIMACFYFITFVLLVVMLYNNKKEAWSKKQKTFMSRLIVGILLSLSVAIVPFAIEFTDPSSYANVFINFAILTVFIQHIGVYINCYAFLKVSKNPWLLQRQKIHLLMVFNRSGIELFNKSFYRKFDQEESGLIAGVFSVINSLVQETTRTPEELESINLKGREVRFISREHFISVIIIDYSTQASEIAHKNFVEEFEKNFSKELRTFKGQSSNFSEAEEIALKYFS
ncbi:MAG: hypothetical protein JXA99_04500 [Candidatus Lokiarchaeota archaeon]|nr:hypothetical protein [Candidatus Lokiarchaeota archaeon]